MSLRTQYGATDKHAGPVRPNAADISISGYEGNGKGSNVAMIEGAGLVTLAKSSDEVIARETYDLPVATLRIFYPKVRGFALVLWNGDYCIVDTAHLDIAIDRAIIGRESVIARK